MITFLFNLLGTKLPNLLLLFGEQTSFGIYEVSRRLTPIGWIVVIIFPLVLIFGIIYLIIKFLKKPKLK